MSGQALWGWYSGGHSHYSATWVVYMSLGLNT